MIKVKNCKTVTMWGVLSLAVISSFIVIKMRQKAWATHRERLNATNLITGTIPDARLGTSSILLGNNTNYALSQSSSDLKSIVDALTTSTQNARVVQSTTSAQILTALNFGSTAQSLLDGLNTSTANFRTFQSTTGALISSLSSSTDSFRTFQSTTQSQINVALSFTSTGQAQVDALNTSTATNRTWQSTATSRMDNLAIPITIRNNGTLQGSGNITTLDFTANITATVSGTTGTISSAGGGIGLRTVFSTNAVTNTNQSDSPHAFIISTGTLQAGTTIFVSSMNFTGTVTGGGFIGVGSTFTTVTYGDGSVSTSAVGKQGPAGPAGGGAVGNSTYTVSFYLGSDVRYSTSPFNAFRNANWGPGLSSATIVGWKAYMASPSTATIYGFKLAFSTAGGGAGNAETFAYRTFELQVPTKTGTSGNYSAYQSTVIPVNYQENFALHCTTSPTTGQFGQDARIDVYMWQPSYAAP